MTDVLIVPAFGVPIIPVAGTDLFACVDRRPVAPRAVIRVLLVGFALLGQIEAGMSEALTGLGSNFHEETNIPSGGSPDRDTREGEHDARNLQGHHPLLLQCRYHTSLQPE